MLQHAVKVRLIPFSTLHLQHRSYKRVMNLINPRDERLYIPIADHGLIGNLRTAALVSMDGSIESYCVPNFDSPSIFARILDKDKGGHFSIMPTIPFSAKQNYLASSNVLQTKFMNDAGVVSVTDFLPRPKKDPADSHTTPKPLLQWLVRRVECIRGRLPILMQCAPAFHYGMHDHTTTIIDDESVPIAIPHGVQQKKAVFVSENLTLDLRYVVENTGAAAADGGMTLPEVSLDFLDLSSKGHRGLAVQTLVELTEGQCVTFILRTPPSPDVVAAQTSLINPRRAPDDPFLTKELVGSILQTTNRYWYDWVSQNTYTGSWKESVLRSALALKLLVYEPTGAVVASPTFSLPEYIGGVRNWDYRASWIRDSSFTLYALIRLGFTEEANSYLEFIFERLRNKNPDGSLQIMYTIHGGKDLEELELLHLDGHKGSRPVRIGNGAADHIQLDIYGELMDCIYLGQKFGKPLGYDDWVLVRELVDFVVKQVKEPDLSIWYYNPPCSHKKVCYDLSCWYREVRNKKRHFTYSKVMLWVALDRGLRLAEKRSLPCPNRATWLATRDQLYEEIMEKSWNKEGKFFGQSYEDHNSIKGAHEPRIGLAK
ncbi:glycoside hydrolase family 15 protein [Hebeloma cylindrosporum]|uniref:Glycoside hydrolase family 15 protein n=1 Tax=Hebeloma cylindrosporum TaxID=76867 RepID=A0A0C3BWQ1_HEBCY|nr:glycoside hydrolase family 15 protein [Hebeloma cylindrosporum h7]